MTPARRKPTPRNTPTQDGTAHTDTDVSDREIHSTELQPHAATPSRTADRRPSAGDDRLTDSLNDPMMNAAPSAGGDAESDGAPQSRGVSQTTSRASNDDDIERRIRDRAYAIFCARRADDGSELEDWLSAEREIRFVRGPDSGSDDVSREAYSQVAPRDVPR